MLFETFGDKKNPAVLFFHAMGVTGESSEPVVKYLQDRYFCILPTSTVYCKGQKYVSKLDEIRQVEDFLHRQGVERLAMVVTSSIGADLAMAFLTQTKLPVEHAFFDGGQFAQIGKGTRRIMTPFLYFAIRSLYWSKGGTLKKIGSCSKMGGAQHKGFFFFLVSGPLKRNFSSKPVFQLVEETRCHSTRPNNILWLSKDDMKTSKLGLSRHFRAHSEKWTFHVIVVFH